MSSGRALGVGVGVDDTSHHSDGDLIDGDTCNLRHGSVDTVPASSSKARGKNKGASRRDNGTSTSSAPSVQAGVITIEAVQLRQEAKMKAKGRGKLSRSAAARAKAAFDASDSSRDSSDASSSDGEGIDHASGHRGVKHAKGKGSAQRKGKPNEVDKGGRHGGGNNNKVKCYFCGRRGHVQEECPG
jgi:stalled ribosome alternative rescue factor ArfA